MLSFSLICGEKWDDTPVGNVFYLVFAFDMGFFPVKVAVTPQSVWINHVIIVVLRCRPRLGRAL